MARKWLEGAAVLRQETLTQPFTKRTDKRADELISASLNHWFLNAGTGQVSLLLLIIIYI
ncbi:MAG: hypothetical protein J6E49_05155 [Acidaminococcaceae bacterium]|nr:hypothetical protein [Acidaminococcaceae bacterium]